MILALVLCFASLYVIRKPDGTPLKTFSNPVSDIDFSGLRESLADSLDSVNSLIEKFDDADGELTAIGNSSSVPQKQLYRWQDDNGIWNFSDNPPPDIDAKRVTPEAPTILNLNPTVSLDESSEGPESTEVAETESSLIPNQLREMQETMQKAEDVTRQFQERMAQQQRILEEL